MRQKIVTDKKAKENEIVHQPFKVVAEGNPSRSLQLTKLELQVLPQNPQLREWKMNKMRRECARGAREARGRRDARHLSELAAPD